MLEDQTISNYQNEFEKIRGALAHNRGLTTHTKHTLERREAELKSLGAKIAIQPTLSREFYQRIDRFNCS